MKNKFIVVKILRADSQRIEKMKIHVTEPKWSVVERALNNLEDLHKRKFPEKK